MKHVKEYARRLRPDGRPEAFDIAQTANGKCQRCLERFGAAAINYRGTLFLISGENSPWRDDITHLICFAHLPDNVVIVDPFEGFQCRNKIGAERWQESDPGIYATDDDLTPEAVALDDLLNDTNPQPGET